MSNIILIGPPGVGKGTQTRIISDRFSLVSISTGDIFRENMKNETELGVQAKDHIDKGELVPDHITNEMISNRLSQLDESVSFLLDGYPRNLEQAKYLDDFCSRHSLSIDYVIAIIASKDILVNRMKKRASEESRSDDTEEVFSRRIEVYEEETFPIIEYYSRKGILHEVDGTGSIESVTRLISQIIS